MEYVGRGQWFQSHRRGLLLWLRHRFGRDGYRILHSLTRAIGEAVRRINADKRKYLHYFIDEVPEELGHLEPDDFTLSRLRFIEPVAYSKQEFDKTYEWMVSWGLVDENTPFEKLVDNRITFG